MLDALRQLIRNLDWLRCHYGRAILFVALVAAGTFAFARATYLALHEERLHLDTAAATLFAVAFVLIFGSFVTEFTRHPPRLPTTLEPTSEWLGRLWTNLVSRPLVRTLEGLAIAAAAVVPFYLMLANSHPAITALSLLLLLWVLACFWWHFRTHRLKAPTGTLIAAGVLAVVVVGALLVFHYVDNLTWEEGFDKLVGIVGDVMAFAAPTFNALGEAVVAYSHSLLIALSLLLLFAWGVSDEAPKGLFKRFMKPTISLVLTVATLTFVLMPAVVPLADAACNCMNVDPPGANSSPERSPSLRPVDTIATVGPPAQAQSTATEGRNEDFDDNAHQSLSVALAALAAIFVIGMSTEALEKLLRQLLKIFDLGERQLLAAKRLLQPASKAASVLLEKRYETTLDIHRASAARSMPHVSDVSKSARVRLVIRHGDRADEGEAFTLNRINELAVSARVDLKKSIFFVAYTNAARNTEIIAYGLGSELEELFGSQTEVVLDHGRQTAGKAFFLALDKADADTVKKIVDNVREGLLTAHPDRDVLLSTTIADGSKDLQSVLDLMAEKSLRRILLAARKPPFERAILAADDIGRFLGKSE